MDENELYVVKEYKFDNPLITDIDFIIDSCLEVVTTNTFIMLKINVSMILNSQISLIIK